MKREIVGAKINGMITNNRELIASAIKSETPIQLLDRWTMELMANCGMGYNWEKMAKSPTLFIINEQGGFEKP